MWVELKHMSTPIELLKETPDPPWPIWYDIWEEVNILFIHDYLCY
jgi:hypothetical protein